MLALPNKFNTFTSIVILVMIQSALSLSCLFWSIILLVLSNGQSNWPHNCLIISNNSIVLSFIYISLSQIQQTLARSQR